MADNLLPSSTDVMECGSLKLPEPCGLHRPAMGLLHFFLFSAEMFPHKFLILCNTFKRRGNMFHIEIIQTCTVLIERPINFKLVEEFPAFYVKLNIKYV
jgi:hypothetical protein